MAAPITGYLVVHQVRGSGVLTVLKGLAVVAAHLYNRAAPQDQVSPDVFMITPDRRAQRVAHLDDNNDNNIVINSIGLLGEVLASLI